MNPGIYRIVNLINGKFYIGSTLNLFRRKAEHKYRGKNNKGNSIIRNSVLKHGYENFQFEIIEKLENWKDLTKDQINKILQEKEQYYVDSLNPDYNIRTKDISRNIEVCSDKQREHLKRISKIPRDPNCYILNGLSRKGRFIGENSKKSKFISVYNKDTNELIETIKGIRECGRKYKIDSSAICKVLKGDYKYHKDYYFKYTNQ